MRMSQNIARLRRMKPAFAAASPLTDRLADLPAFGANPGKLRARCYVPESLAAKAALVVVLHGCTQTAAAYDHGAGWSRLADRYGFALLFPEQKRENNPGLCFNWFQPGDVRRGGGEAASIRQMVAKMFDLHDLDPARVFVTGLSAGGGMTSAMLAAYPDVFAGGAIIAGIPYGCADNVQGAFECMGGGGRRAAATLGDKVRGATSHKGPWPKVSVWHGSSDNIVAASNGEDAVRQWVDIHDLVTTPDRVETVDGHPRRVWTGERGEVLVEQYVIAGMGHGTPLSPGNAPGRSGVSGPHMLDVGLSSTNRIAEFWGIADATATEARVPETRKPAAAKARPRHATRKPAAQASGVTSIIENALRAAGLLK